MELSYAVAVMDKIEGWEKKKEYENQIGAKKVLSPRPGDLKNFIFTLHPTTEAINKTWNVLHGTHEWLQQHSMELQECKNLKSLQFDIQVPCIMQWRLLWYSARSHLNEVLNKIGTLKKCYDKTIINAMETVHYTLGKKTHAQDSLLGNADGDDGAVHARVGVAS